LIIVTSEHLIERIEAMRSAILSTSLSNRLIDLPRNSASRLIRFNGSAQAIRDALAAGQHLEVGKDLLQTEGSADSTRLNLKKMISADAALQDLQGLSALQIGLGVIDWIDEVNQWRSAPLVLWPIRATIDDEQIIVQASDSDGQINEVLLAKIALGREDLPADPLDSRWKPAHPRIARFEDRAVLDLFSQARWAMARRLSPKHHSNLLNHAILRRLVLSDQSAGSGGFPPSTQLSRLVESATTSDNLHVEPSDSSQDRAVTLTRTSSNEILIQGPPGTGKSQTIVNIIANAIEDNKTVLFMAEKMNAIEVVWDKLAASKYGKENAKRMIMLQGRDLRRSKIAERFGKMDNMEIVDVLAACPDHERPSVILTSPEAYALHVPDNWMFDMLIVDEASQMHLSSAAAAIAASRQIVICGDSQQMQPDMLSGLSGNEVNDTRLSVSLLMAAEEAGFPATLLERHYRSRHPELIDFSNAMFYKGRLTQTPAFRTRRWNYGVKYYPIAGNYNHNDRTNPNEARAVADKVCEYLKAAAKDRKSYSTPDSVGVIAMNEDQRDLIESYLQESIREYGDCLPKPLFIRTIDTVQGEERDFILISLTYGPEEEGNPVRNFGQISRPHGDKRVNVMATRSRYRTEIFSSVNPDTIALTGNMGVEALLFYLSAAQKGFPTLAGKRLEGRFARHLQTLHYRVEVFGQAYCFRYRDSSENWKTKERLTPDEDNPNIAAVYLTGLKNEFDERSEIAQYEYAGWSVVEIPHNEFADFCRDDYNWIADERFKDFMSRIKVHGVNRYLS
jgi:hypothetical protein